MTNKKKEGKCWKDIIMYVNKIKAFFKNKNKDNKTRITYGCNVWTTTSTTYYEWEQYAVSY